MVYVLEFLVWSRNRQEMGLWMWTWALVWKPFTASVTGTVSEAVYRRRNSFVFLWVSLLLLLRNSIRAWRLNLGSGRSLPRWITAAQSPSSLLWGVYSGEGAGSGWTLVPLGICPDVNAPLCPRKWFTVLSLPAALRLLDIYLFITFACTEPYLLHVAFLYLWQAGATL